MEEVLQGIMTTKYKGTHRMAVFINEEDLVFLRIGSPQIKVGVYRYTVAWKKLPELQKFIETPKYVYAMLKSNWPGSYFFQI